MSDSTDQECLTCGKPTSNPKYCSRSCAAKANNRKAPKRKPEGKCEECGTAISTRYRLCDSCQQAIVQQADDRGRNVKTFIDPAGNATKEAVAQVSIFHKTTFELRGAGTIQPPFDPAHPCSDLLDFLLGVTIKKSAYVRDEDAPRFTSLLRAFRDFKAKVWDKTETVEDRVANLPIRCLDDALEYWVRTLFDAQHHPMMPIYALGLGEFMEPHVFDLPISLEDDHPWKIIPVVKSMEYQAGNRVRTLGLLHDSNFKREFSQQINGLQAVVQVPAGAAVYAWDKENPVFSAGDQFPFEILRCHLTKGGFHDHVNLVVKEDSPPRFDIAENFNIRGSIIEEIPGVGTHPASRRFAQAMRPQKQLVVPVRWITHTIEWESRPHARKLLPVPTWDVPDTSSQL